MTMRSKASPHVPSLKEAIAGVPPEAGILIAEILHRLPGLDGTVINVTEMKQPKPTSLLMNSCRHRYWDSWIF